MKPLKILTVILVLVMLLAACSNAASDTGSADDSHTHVIDAEWVVDLENHWQLCTVCGEKMGVDLHTMNEFDVCEVCGKSVWDQGDGVYGIGSYDEYGSLCEDATYDAEGNLVCRYRYVYEYYEDGNIQSEKHYAYDPAWYGEEEMLLLEASYRYCENSEFGEVYQSEATFYEEDGSKTHFTFDESGEVLTETIYDVEGNVME